MNIEQIREYVKNAKKHNACEKAISAIESHNTVEGILTDYRAPEWAFWYARNMIEGRWP